MMKNDINLLYKREIKKGSKNKVALAVLAVIAIAAALYAGLALTYGQIEDLKTQAAELDSHMGSSTGVLQQLSDKSLQIKLLNVKKDEIIAIGESKSDIKNYIEAIESSLPTDANITSLSFSEQTMNLTGVTSDDTVIATFCLKLRQQNVFSEVLIAGSKLETDGSISFNITAVLNKNLNTLYTIEAIEQKENPLVSPAASPEATK